MLRKIKDNKYLKKLTDLFPWLFVIAGMIFTSALIAQKGNKILSSDFAVELVLARHLNEEHTLVSTTWAYSTWVRIFDVVMVRKLVFAIIGYGNWLLSRVITNLIMMIILTASYIYTAKAAGFWKKGLWTAAALCWPFGVWYVLNVLYGGFYYSFMINYILSLGLIINLSSRDKDGEKRKVTILRIAALCVLALISGCDGVRGLMCFGCPLVAGAVIYTVLNDAAGDTAGRKKCFRFTGYTMLVFAVSCLGYLINKYVLPAKFSFSANYGTNPVWIKLDPGKILATYADFLQLLGYRTGVNIMSKMGVINFLAIILAAMYVLSLVRLCRNFKELSFAHRIITVYNVSFGIFLSVIYMVSDWAYNESYWVPLLPFVFITLQAEYDSDPLLKKDSLFGTKAVAAVFVICILGVSYSTYLSPYNWAHNNSDSCIDPVAGWLDTNGYECGYATFWNSSIVEELTNGNIRMYSVHTIAENANPGLWLDVLDTPQGADVGKAFVLIGYDELLTITEAQREYIVEKMAYDDGVYVVVPITSLTDYRNDMIERMN